MSIFVVDDERILAEATTAILKLNGYPATAFTDPYVALTAARSGCPSLLITDLKMPGISGVELAFQLRDLCPNCRIILFTAQLHNSDLLHGARGYGFSFLHKPVSVAELLLAVSSGRRCD
jgi:DNA-binding response OmpR family regulator